MQKFLILIFIFFSGLSFLALRFVTRTYRKLDYFDKMDEDLEDEI